MWNRNVVCVPHTQSKSCPDDHAYQKPYIGLSVPRKSQWMMALHPCPRRKALSGWLPWDRGRSRSQVTSDGSRLEGPFVSEGVQQVLLQLLASSGSWQSPKLPRCQEEPCRGQQRLCWVRTLCLDNLSFRRIWLKKRKKCLHRILKQPKKKEKRKKSKKERKSAARFCVLLRKPSTWESGSFKEWENAVLW